MQGRLLPKLRQAAGPSRLSALCNRKCVEQPSKQTDSDACNAEGNEQVKQRRSGLLPFQDMDPFGAPAATKGMSDFN
jgi:hypothetical protein